MSVASHLKVALTFQARAAFHEGLLDSVSKGFVWSAAILHRLRLQSTCPQASISLSAGPDS